MNRLDYINQRLEACGEGVFMTPELVTETDIYSEFSVQANQFLAGISLLRAKLRETSYSDELKTNDNNDVITFTLNRIYVGNILLNAMIKLVYVSPTTYKITFHELSRVYYNEQGEEYVQ